ncbi:MAG TPA: ergothioneine biosynthesis glutamate--cysteine ligase EgtA [Nocardioidaceae bacterium]|nr:ergothioneine biosynthesis glutamate--cysteine ligase EgtA [Nocardioidaceae bacterium]
MTGTVPESATEPIASRADAEGYVAMICFKHGPPQRLGVELEWTVHHVDDPTRALDAVDLGAALGPHAPPTLAPHSPHLPLPGGSLLTVEPGGQVEVSSAPDTSVTTLLSTLDRDVAALDTLLRTADLVRGEHGIDAHRLPRRLLGVPRYAAMQSAFDRIGPRGSQMMCSTASMQICVDAGEPPDSYTRWRAAHAVGPALVALFANSRRLAGHDTGWASARLRATVGTCPPTTEPPAHTDDPASAWAALAMAAPVLCVRRDSGCWDAPVGLTFADWVAGGHAVRPTYDDLDYHLSTLFPPVRPRGYLELRYLDAQPPARWHDPVLLVSALMSDPGTVDAALDAAGRAADRWLQAAQHGLADEPVLEAASALVEIGAAAMTRLDVAAADIEQTIDRLQARIADHSMRRHSA